MPSLSDSIRERHQHTLERIAESGTRVLGMVLNRAQIKRRGYYYGKYYGQYYGHYYGSNYGRPEQAVPNDRPAKVANIKDRGKR